MTPRQAMAFIKRQFYQGNAWKDGIATMYITQKSTSLTTFKEALQIVGGEVWRENDWQEKQNVTKHFYQVICFVPNEQGMDFQP